MVQSRSRVRVCAWSLCPLGTPWAMLPLAAKTCLGSYGWPRAKWLHSMYRQYLPNVFSLQNTPRFSRRTTPSNQTTSPFSCPPESLFRKITATIILLSVTEASLHHKNDAFCCTCVLLQHRYFPSPAGPASFPSFKASSSVSFIHHHQQCTDINKIQAERMIIVGYVK